MPSTILFLPGALGRRDIWHPVADRLVHPAHKVHVAWPGFDDAPPDPSVRGLDDLAARLAERIDGPTALVAQSMGGIVAILAALRKPDCITHLVLSVTSGGIDMAACGGEDWRPAVRAAHPHLPDWFLTHGEDLAPRLPALTMPALLLWGDADPISPVAAGRNGRLGSQRHWHKLRRCTQQTGPQLATPAKHHVPVQPVLQRQLGYRHRLIARLLRQAPLELQWIVLAAPARLLLCFTHQDSPHQKIVGTTLRRMRSSVYTVRRRRLHLSERRQSK
jgi:pimeloyl-ACP methyl ester carboxylesterase